MTKELVVLRSNTPVRFEADPSWMIKCKALEKERGELRSSLKTSEEQLGTIRREAVVLTVKASSMDPEKYMLKSDHAALLKKREGGLLADMKLLLVKGHAEMRRQTGCRATPEGRDCPY